MPYKIWQNVDNSDLKIHTKKVKKIKDLKSLTEYQLWQKKKKKMKACENKTKKQWTEYIVQDYDSNNYYVELELS